MKTGLLVRGALICWLAVGLGCFSNEARAWGADGHVAVATVAASFIAPSTAAEVRTLLGGWGSAEDQMAKASVWADEIRVFHPETGEWHFVNIPLGAAGYDPGRDCEDGGCIVAALDRFANVLRDRQAPPAARTEALKYLIHFMGDVAQPLHCSDNGDHGGNGLHVVVGGKRRSLHQVWDTDIVEAAERQAGVVGGRGLGAWVAARISPQQRSQWASGGAADWANQSHGVAVGVAYAGISGRGGNDARTPIVLGQGYVDQAVPVVEAQIALAGVRLAAELDMLLGR